MASERLNRLLGVRWRQYALAVFLTAAALLLRMAVTPWVGERPLLIIFFIPIVISAYVGGLGPGLLATALVGLATLFVLPPVGSFSLETPLDIAQWLFMLLEGVLISVLFQEVSGARLRTRRARGASRHSATERKVRAGFAVALAFIGAIGIVGLLSVERLAENTAKVSHTHEVITWIDNLLGTAVGAEAAQRGYVITGDEKFVDTFKYAASEADTEIAALRELLGDHPAQRQKLETLTELMAARLSAAAQVIQIRRDEGFDAARAALESGRGPALQSRLHERAHEMKAVERRLLDERELRAVRSASLTKSFIIGGSALALTFMGLALFAIRRDFAGRERAEDDLTQFFSLSLDFLVIAGFDGYFKRVSPAVTDLLGWSVEEALATPYLDLIHPEDMPAALRELERQRDRGEQVDKFYARFRHKNGSWRTLSWRSMPRGGLMFATARDITDVVQSERELREAKQSLELRVAERTAELEKVNAELAMRERRFRALIENGSDSIALIDQDNRILYLSPAVQNVEGYKPEELIGKVGPDNTHPDDVPLVQAYVAELLANPGKSIPVLWRRRHKDGHWLWLEGVATNLLDDPAVGAIVTNYRDVTERRAAEARTREQLQRLALLSRVTRAIGERLDLRSIFQVVIRTLEDDLPVDFCCVCLYDAGENRLTVSCVGARSEQTALALGMTEDAELPIDENGLARCVRGELVYEPDITGSAFSFPRRLAGAGLSSLAIAPLLVESQVFGVLISARNAADAFSSGECEFLRQVSEHTALAAHQAQLYGALQETYDELRQSQQQIMQQERLRALGQMASGIAHDINNAISPVALYTEALLERETSLSERGRAQLEIIQRAVEDVAQTVARMGEFYRLREPQAALVPVDLNKLINQVLDLTRARWSDMAQQRGAAIETRTELAAGLPSVSGVESQIRDALVNLVFNAVDAMPSGGPLTLRTRVSADGTHRVQLEVVDAGRGMDEETRRRCLEPFFTTKGTRGTGLGLPMVYGVAQRHDATLEIESEPGKGTTVRLSFAPAAGATDASPRSQPPTVNARRILIIDDDPLLLKSLRDALESDGHSVVAANGGQVGIDAFLGAQAAGEPFPVVITDLGMPHVDGRKVAAAIKAAAPDTVILMLTGWGRRLVAEGDTPHGISEVLSKPPKLAELRAALARHVRR